MVSVVDLLLLVTAFLAVLFLLKKRREDKGVGTKLPGPMGLPFLGSIISVGVDAHLSLSSWVQNYGPAFIVDIVGKKLVVISDVKLAKTAYSNPLLLGKPDDDLFKVLSGGSYGVISTNSHEWVEQRRFTLRNLRDFGFGKTSGQDLVMDEVTEFLEGLKVLAQSGKSFSLDQKFSLAVVNSLWQMMTGKRFKHDDPQLIDILETQFKAFESVTESPVGIFLPELSRRFPKLSGWAKVVTSTEALNEIFRKSIKEHKAEFAGGPEDIPRDFIDSYIKEIKQTTDSQSTFFGEPGDKHMLATVSDLFGAGSGTTSSTLSWNILYLTTYPEIQEKVQKEIDSVVGKTRVVTLADRKDLPYLEAVIAETLRKSSITPMGLFHSAIEDTTLGQYRIPKGASLCVNQYHIHHDPEIWGKDANIFRPERFLSPDGKSVEKNEALVAFSIGKRNCIGESLARDTLFLFLANIYQRFSISQCPNSPKPSLESRTKLFLQTEIFNVVVKDRNLDGGLKSGVKA